MFDKMKLLNRLRRIWFRKERITPDMIVQSLKALYEFVTGKPALCISLLLLSLAGTANCSEYKLIGPGQRRVTRYQLAPSLSEPVLRSSRKKADKVIVVSATWCQPCKRMYPIVERLAAEGYDAEVVYDYDGPSVITAYPTILFLLDGKVIYKNVGVTPERTLRYNLVKP